MRKIIIPEQVLVTDFFGNIIQKEPVTIHEFIKGRLSDLSFGKDMSTILATIRIDKQLNSKEEYILLEESDWKILKQSVETPNPPYSPIVAKNYSTFMQAIVDAKEDL